MVQNGVVNRLRWEERMRVAKILGIVALVYVLLVTAFESLVGYFQPQGQDTLVLTTTDADGNQHDRVLSELESGGNAYVAVNHWPRAWYGRVLANPDVMVRRSEEPTAHPHTAVAVAGEEEARVAADNPLGVVVRILTGFPPRHFVRLDPVAATTAPSSSP